MKIVDKKNPEIIYAEIIGGNNLTFDEAMQLVGYEMDDEGYITEYGYSVMEWDCEMYAT